ncbi:MAG: AmmeMemoRadiSam system protein B [Planctomycetota bacterium]
MSIRKPAVAGQFYPGRKEQLLAELERYLSVEAGAQKAVGVVAPHAGYVYSGGTAGAVYSRVKIPDRVAVLSPNHTGMGSPVSVWAEGSWLTPLGAVEVDAPLAAALLERCPEAQGDEAAHAREHSLEVQLPFLQKLNPDAKVLPVTLGTHRASTLESVGRALASAITDAGGDVLVVASSDMTHFESAESARRRDEMALEKLRAMDPAGLIDVVTRERISMCGAAPAAVMLWAAKELGATGCELVDYTHSGMVTGDDSEVVAYAGLICR